MNLIFGLLIWLASSIALAENFTDTDLASLIKSHRMGMIYIWSPHMPLSDLFKSDAEKIANELSIGYQELLDPHSRIQVKGIKELNSKKILQLGVLNHYPAILLFKNGTLLKQVIHGHENKSSLKMLIKKRLKI